MSDQDDKKYWYIGGALLLLLLLWRRKKPSLPAPAQAQIPTPVNVLDNLPNPYSAKAAYQATGTHTSNMTMYNVYNGLISIPRDQQAPLFSFEGQAPQDDTSYGIRIGVTKAPEDGFLARLEDLSDDLGVSAGSVDGGPTMGNQRFQTAISHQFLSTLKGPGLYVLSLTLVPEMKKNAEGKYEAVSLTSEQLNALPRSYMLAEIPERLA